MTNLKKEHKQEPNFHKQLKEYFNTTPREKVLEDWAKSSHLDNVGPTVDEFIENNNDEDSLEEAAKNYIKLPLNINVDEEQRYYNPNIKSYDAFIAGALWQAEQNKNLYSEEEVLDILNEFNVVNYSPSEKDDIFEWFKRLYNK